VSDRFEPVDVSTFEGGPEQWLRSAGELLRSGDPGPTEFLVDELLVDQSVATILGSSKAAKTWTALELACAIVTGRPAFGRFAVPQPGPVIVLLEESGEKALHRRLDALRRGNAQEPEAFDRLWYGANLRVRLDEPHWRERLIAAAVQIRPRAVFLDPLVRMKGFRSENDQAEMAVVLDTILDLRETAGTCVVFNHHTGHEGKHLRGTSDLEAFWESKVTITKDDGLRKVTSEHREAEAGPAWAFRLGWDAESRTMRLRAEEDELERAVRVYLRDHPDATGNEIAKAIGKRRADVLDVVRRLDENLEPLTQEGGSHFREPPGTTPFGAPEPAGSHDPHTPRRGVGSGTTAGADPSGWFPTPGTTPSGGRSENDDEASNEEAILQEVAQLVDEGVLAPLDTTDLLPEGSFCEGCDDNDRCARDLSCRLVDIAAATYRDENPGEAGP
jgi:hypothetical protein